MTCEDFREFLPRYVWHMEEPVCEPPAVALYFVSRLARQSGVKVLLSGEGGDEAFAGYQTYRNLLAFERLKTTLGPARGLLHAPINAASILGWTRAKPYARLIGPALSEYYLSRTSTPASGFNPLKRALYRAQLAETLSGIDQAEPTRRLFETMQGRPLLDQMLYVDSKTWLPDDLLVKADKMTMATSVELRVPLLDFRVLEFAASLPETFKVRRWSGKRILKAALEDSVPREILTRKKTGFPVPYDRWLRAELQEYVRDTLNSSAAITTYFETDVVHQLVERFYQTGTGSKQLFSLVVLELWLKCFVAGAPGRTDTPATRLERHSDPVPEARTA
jgi:asparagine synthase (glutamine-hydrolysing)